MYSGRSGFESPLGYAIFGSDLGVSRSRKKCRSESGTTINKSGASGTQKDQESLKSKKTRRVWNQKDQESLEPEEGRTGESKTGRGKTRRVQHRE
jgi:hypothetical protein